MRSQTSDRQREQRFIFGLLQPPNIASRQFRYWPVDIDIHNQKVAELRSNPAERWVRYLRSLPPRHLTSEAAAAAAERFWTQLLEEVDSLTPPNASPTDEGGVLMSWTDKGHHVEVEFAPTGEYEWFYRHRASNTTDGAPVEDESISPQLIRYIEETRA